MGNIPFYTPYATILKENSQSLAFTHAVTLASRQAGRTHGATGWSASPQSLGNLLPFEIQFDFWELSGNFSYLYGIAIPYSLMGRVVQN